MLQTETAPLWRQTETKILSGLRSLLEAETVLRCDLLVYSVPRVVKHKTFLRGFSTIALPATLKFDYASQNRSIYLTGTVN